MLRAILSLIVVCFALPAQTREVPVDGTPLLRAKLALELARSRVLENRYDDASAALRLASKALGDYAKLSPGPHAETADFIRQEIARYSPRVIRNQQDALDRIDLWSEPVDKWYADTHKPPVP